MEFKFEEPTLEEQAAAFRVNGNSFWDCIIFATMPRSKAPALSDSVEELLDFLSNPEARASLTDNDWQLLLAYIAERWERPAWRPAREKNTKVPKPLSELAIRRLLRSAVALSFALCRDLSNSKRLSPTQRAELAGKTREVIAARFPDRQLEQVGKLVSVIERRKRRLYIDPRQIDKFAPGLTKQLIENIKSSPPVSRK